MLITVSGPPGSGTTTAAEHVAARLELELVPGGRCSGPWRPSGADAARVRARYATDHPEVDVELDRRLAERARGGDVVIESRLAGWIARNEGLVATRCGSTATPPCGPSGWPSARA